MSRRPFAPKVVAANHLLKGDAVWLTEDDSWTRDIKQAELIEDEAVAERRVAQKQPEGDRQDQDRADGLCEDPENAAGRAAEPRGDLAQDQGADRAERDQPDRRVVSRQRGFLRQGVGASGQDLRHLSGCCRPV